MANYRVPSLNPFGTWDFNHLLSLLDTDNELKAGIEKLQKLAENAVQHRYVAENGKLMLEAVVAGHNPDNIKVKFNEKTHTMRIEDSNLSRL